MALAPPGGFVRPLSKLHGFVQGGGQTRTVQDGDIAASAYTISFNDLTGPLEVAAAADVAASTTLTLPSVANLVTSGFRVGDHKEVPVKNNKTAQPIVFAGGASWTSYGNVTLGPATTGTLHLIVLTATTGLFYLDKLNLPTAPANPITASTTLTAADSGRTFGITQGAVVIAITLPTPVAGFQFDFVVTTAGAANVTLSTGATDLWGVIFIGAAGPTAPIARQVDNDTTLTIVGGSAAAGDYLRFVGVTTGVYLVYGASSVSAASITIA